MKSPVKRAVLPLLLLSSASVTVVGAGAIRKLTTQQLNRLEGMEAVINALTAGKQAQAKVGIENFQTDLLSPKVSFSSPTVLPKCPPKMLLSAPIPDRNPSPSRSVGVPTSNSRFGALVAGKVGAKLGLIAGILTCIKPILLGIVALGAGVTGIILRQDS